MSENMILMQDDSLYSKYFAEDLTKAIKDTGNREFSEARKLWNKLGLTVAVTGEEMVSAVVEKLSENLTKGLLQLTVEKITSEKECKDALREKKIQSIVMHMSGELPSFKIYAEFIIKSGSVELKKFRFDFEVEPNIEIEEINVTIQEYKIKSVSFGTFKASLTLSLLKDEQAIKIVSIEKSLDLPGLNFEGKLPEAMQADIIAKAELALPKRNIEITTGENVFGRMDFESDLPVAELGYISKNEGGNYHFKIIKQGRIVHILDEHSINGTKVNDREIKGKGRIELKNGDKITLAGISNFTITFKISGA